MEKQLKKSILEAVSRLLCSYRLWSHLRMQSLHSRKEQDKLFIIM